MPAARGEIALPRAAGNEYQGVSQDLTISLVTERGHDASDLARTGSDIRMLALGGLVVVALGGAVIVVARRRARAAEAADGGSTS